MPGTVMITTQQEEVLPVRCALSTTKSSKRKLKRRSWPAKNQANETTMQWLMKVKLKRQRLTQLTPARVISIKCLFKAGSQFSWRLRMAGDPLLLLSHSWLECQNRQLGSQIDLKQTTKRQASCLPSGFLQHLWVLWALNRKKLSEKTSSSFKKERKSQLKKKLRELMIKGRLRQPRMM